MAELTSPSNQNSRGTRSSSIPRVDLTAMVDLAFLLITFFMLTTTLSKKSGMDLAMPVGDDPGKVSEARTMTVCLGDHNKMLWYMGTTESPSNTPEVHNFSGKAIRKAILFNSKKVLEETGKGLILLIKPSDKSEYGDLVNILDEVALTKVSTYAIVDIDKTELDMMRSKQIY